ncbi:MAG: hypothetical protein IKI21_03230 [Oscillospiraceae bacterium]|nr:hypothetical protein [Oscillospiraceae bacterium]
MDSIVQRYDSHMILPETGISIEDDPHFFNWTAAKHTLDQHFLRARYGGEYNTRAGVREMWFRVSSVGVWWHDVIRSFVEEHQDAISDVTVERDRETDCEDTPHYYRDAAGAPYLHMPTAQFLASVPDKAAP